MPEYNWFAKNPLNHSISGGKATTGIVSITQRWRTGERLGHHRRPMTTNQHSPRGSEPAIHMPPGARYPTPDRAALRPPNPTLTRPHLHRKSAGPNQRRAYEEPPLAPRQLMAGVLGLQPNLNAMRFETCPSC